MKEILDQYVKEGKLIVNEHPTEDLFIYNYSRHTEYNSLWDEITLRARGLVVNSKGVVVATPFPKFFNIEQLSQERIDTLRTKDFAVFEKLDGCLGIGFTYNSKFIIASRGSFTSEQSQFAMKAWNEKLKHNTIEPDPECTYIFEIIYKEGRIVINYDFEDIVLLGATKNGKEVDYDDLMSTFTIKSDCTPIRLVKRYDGINDFESLREQFPEKNDGKSEGFIVKFSNKEFGMNYRVKLKYSEYFRLHALVADLTTTRIYQYLKHNVSVLPLLETVPDEYHKAVVALIDELLRKYSIFSEMAIELMRSIYKEGMTAKEFSEKVNSIECTAITRNLLYAQFNCKWNHFEDLIFQLIEPAHSQITL